MEETVYTIYTKDNCIWCVRAKQLMNELGLHYKELKLGVDYTREELKNRLPPNRPLTVPQIYAMDNHIGGYEDFKEYIESLTKFSTFA